MFNKKKTEPLIEDHDCMLDDDLLYDMAQNKLWIDGYLFEYYQSDRTFEVGKDCVYIYTTIMSPSLKDIKHCSKATAILGKCKVTMDNVEDAEIISDSRLGGPYPTKLTIKLRGKTTIDFL